MALTTHRGSRRGLRWVAAAVGLIALTASGPQAGHTDRPPWELVYLFDAGNTVHLERASRLHSELAAMGAPASLYGVVAGPAALETARAPFEAASRAAGVPSELLTAAQAWDEGLGPQGLLWATGDRLALRDGAGVEVASAAGARMADVLERLQGAVRLAGPAISTDVNFSTWGKVKDLFR